MDHKGIADLIVLMNFLSDLYHRDGLTNPFIIFQNIIEHSVKLYVEKSIKNLYKEVQVKMEKDTVANLFDRTRVNTITDYGILNRQTSQLGFCFE